jgi:hemoglobin-like flavoprotein
MTLQQIQLVQTSFARVIPRSETMANVFYKRLFALDSSLRQMFPVDLTEQKKKLMSVLQLAVKSLEKFEALVPALENFGRKHATYGVRDQHYKTVGAALILTLKQMLGEEFTPEIKTAWLETYALIAGTMRQAAQEEMAQATLV